MGALFLDTSAIVRRYDASEVGATRVRRACAPSSGHTIYVARLASVEVASALARKEREGTVSVAQRIRLWQLFRSHWRAQYQVVALPDAALDEGEQLLFRHSLRAYDAVHLAAALIVARAAPSLHLEFWTADRQQAAAARVEKLPVTLLP